MSATHPSGGIGAVAPVPHAVTMATAGALAAAAALHVAWGLGSSFPCGDRATLADVVVGGSEVPAPRACFAVAAALGSASALVAGVPARWPGLVRAGRAGVAVALGSRALVGLSGHHELVTPVPPSDRFLRWDRVLYTPLCLALAGGASRAAVAGRPARPGP
jgi:hypothetical protein